MFNKLFLATALVGFVPGLVAAGSLDPSDAPAPTMKTLDQVPPTWSQNLPCAPGACPRFDLVLGGAGVLDKETGLVWESNPSLQAVPSYAAAENACKNLYRGDRTGWRLPSATELLSVVDRSRTNPALPLGSPFTNIKLDSFYYSSSVYWPISYTGSLTGNQISLAHPPPVQWVVYLSTGAVTEHNVGDSGYVWCVRGGSSVADFQR